MPDFTLRCQCGSLIHANRDQLGRAVRCRCGATLSIREPDAAPSAPSRSGRRRSTRRGSRWLKDPAAAFSSARRRTLGEFRSPRLSTRLTARLHLTYLVAIVATWLALIFASERWLPATLLAYGPRAVVLLPLLLLVPAGLFVARRTLLFSLLGGALATTQIMGYQLSLSPGGEADDREAADREAVDRATAADDRAVRVLTLNAAGTRLVRGRLLALLLQFDPDVVNLQECTGEIAELVAANVMNTSPDQLNPDAANIRTEPRWYTAQHRGLCTLSRWPLGEPDSMPRADFARLRSLGYGGAALAVRYEVMHPSRPFQIVNLHLETARKGLEGLIGPDGLLPDDGGLPDALPFTQGRDRVDANALIRRRESQRASEWASRDAQRIPVLVAGDFNLPVESTIYRESWRRWVNAFSRTGRGFGYTKSEGRLLRIRIDHVLGSSAWWDAAGAWLGPDVGSDHFPLIADFLPRIQSPAAR